MSVLSFAEIAFKAGNARFHHATITIVTPCPVTATGRKGLNPLHCAFHFYCESFPLSCI